MKGFAQEPSLDEAHPAPWGWNPDFQHTANWTTSFYSQSYFFIFTETWTQDEICVFRFEFALCFSVPVEKQFRSFPVVFIIKTVDSVPDGEKGRNVFRDRRKEQNMRDEITLSSLLQCFLEPSHLLSNILSLDLSPPASPLSALYPSQWGDTDSFGEPVPVWDWSVAWMEEMDAQYKALYPGRLPSET